MPRQVWIPHTPATAYPPSYPYRKINSLDRPEKGPCCASDPVLAG